MAETDRPGYSFSPGAPPEASRYLSNKDYRPAFSWQDVEPEEHAVAFNVAKATDMDVLTAIREELQTALDEGLPLAEFQKRLKPRLQARGWWGFGGARDQVDGQEKPAQLGSPRRLRTIYNANIRSARSAGQWERIQRTKRALPFLRYQLGPSEFHRPHHADKEGITLPADDPFWQTWFTPNGWGCKCWVRQITQREAEAGGIDTSPDIPTRPVANPRTGEIKDVPVGIDPGWEGNPGLNRVQAVEQLLAGRLRAADPAVARAASRDIATSWRMRQMATNPAAIGNAPLGVIDAEIARKAGVTDPVVQFSDQSRRHVFEERTDRRLSDLRFAADIGSADRIFLQQRSGQQPRLIFEVDSAIDLTSPDLHDRLPLRFIVVFKDSGTFLNTFHRTTARRTNELRNSDAVKILKDN